MWKAFIEREREQQYFIDLEAFLDDEYATKEICPSRGDIFAAFDRTPLEDIKVVICALDPYINGEATGLAFSVKSGCKVPSSMRNILKELKDDLGVTCSPDLFKWADEGVFLLNNILTVEAKKTLSHANKGWEIFTDRAIKAISDHSDGVCFILWGNHARSKKNIIDERHCIIESSHPSGLSARRTKTPFIGSKCFTRCNDYLISIGKEPVDFGS